MKYMVTLSLDGCCIGCVNDLHGCIQFIKRHYLPGVYCKIRMVRR